MERSFRVAAFARLAGVTVRTLQYYDRIDLLKPSGTTEGGHRLYQHKDLLRLQQIIMLKWMGFPLKQIKKLLDSPTYDLLSSLRMQKAAIDEQINRLQQASAALEQALQTASASPGEIQPDTDTLSVVIRGITQWGGEAWIQQYYSESAMAGLQLRGMSITPEQIKQWEQEWNDLFAGFEQHQNQPPDSPQVQALAAKRQALLDGFIAGDPEVEAGLRRFTADVTEGNIPPEYAHYAPYQNMDASLRDFIQEAVSIYQKRKRRENKMDQHQRTVS